MAKRKPSRSSNAPGGSLPKAFRTKRRSKRTGQNLTAGQTGAMGFQKYQGGTKPRFKEGSPTPIIVVQNPANPQQGRVVAVGKKGGVYGRGGSNKTRWTDMEAIKKISGNLLPAAVATIAAGAGIQYLKNTDMAIKASAKIPGGMNTVVFGAGALTAYAAYKYRNFLIFMAGLGIGAYALVKLGTKEAKLSMTGEEEYDQGTVIDQGGQSATAQAPKPDAASTFDARVQKAPAAKSETVEEAGARLISEGNALFAKGDYGAAQLKYIASRRANEDPLPIYNLGRALHKQAEDLANTDIAKARQIAQAAKAQYLAYITERSLGHGSDYMNKAGLDALFAKANGFVGDIDEYLTMDDETAAAPSAVSPSFEGGVFGADADAAGSVRGADADAAGSVRGGEEELDEDGYPVAGMSGSIYVG